MSNRISHSGTAPDNASYRHLFHCAAVALALAAATFITMPKLETAAVGATDADIQTASNATPEIAACLQTWPYYERSCLHDGRPQDGNGRTVRLIATGGPAPRHPSRH